MNVLESLLRNILEISLSMAAVIALLFLLRPLFKKYYRAKWMFWVWLLLAVRLIVPFTFTLPNAPVRIPQPSLSLFYEPPQSVAPPAPVEGQPPMEGQGDSYPVAAVTPPAENVYTRSLSVEFVWVVGFCAVLGWELISYIRFRRRVRRWRTEVSDGALLSQFNALKAELGVKNIGIAQCSAISSPMVTGFLHPALLLPPGDVPEAVLRHELIHAKRHDLWYKLLLVFARAVHWFNPLVWFMARQAGQDLELSCDEAVVAGRDEGFRAGYGKAILSAMESGQAREQAPLTTYFHSGKKAMLERLQSIVNTKAKRRGAVALALAAVLTLAVSAACAITPPTQRVDGGAYQLTVPADLAVKRTEVSPEGFFSSYYEVKLSRNGSTVVNIERLTIPGFADMTMQEYIDVLHPAQRQLIPYTFPGGLKGAELAYSSENIPHWQSYYIATDDSHVLSISFSRAVFTSAETDAMMASLTMGYSLTPAPKGSLALSYDFTEDDAVWYLWDISQRNPKLLEATSVPAKYRVIGGLLWSQDGKWAAVPSTDGGLKSNYRILGMGKSGFTQDISTLFSLVDDPASLFAASGVTLDYTPIPETLELQVTGFVENPFPHAELPAVRVNYSWLDTAGGLQSGAFTYPCEMLETSYRPENYTPLADVEQNTPCVPTVWEDGTHTFSLPLLQGATVSAPDSQGIRAFTGPNGEYLGRIFKVKEPRFNSQALEVSTQTRFYWWRDEIDDRYYQMELCEADLQPNLAIRMAEGFTMEGKGVSYYYDVN